MTNSAPVRLISVYARVSTAKQEEDGTIETQLVPVREYARDKGYIIVKEYHDDGWSGDTLIRPGLDELRQDAKKGIWDAVLCYDPDRLARRYSYQALVMEELSEAGTEVIFVTIPAPKNSEEKIFHGMRGLFAEYERAKITERFRLGKLRSANEGHIMVSQALYGYNHIPNLKLPNQPKVHGYYEINEEEAAVVRKMFEWIAYEDLNIRQVVRRLQEFDIKPRKSKRGVWNPSTLTTLLRNRAYIGEAHWRSSIAVEPKNPIKKEKYRQQTKTSRRPRPSEEWLIIPVPKIIDEALFNKVRERLAVHIARNPRSKKYEYLLGSLMRCSCGCKRGGAARKHGQYLYYDCYDKVYCFPLPKNCHENPINARIADGLVWKKLSDLMTSPKLLTKHLEEWKKEQSKKTESSVGDTSAMGKQLFKLRGEEERYTKAYGSGVFTLEQLKEYTVPVREKITSLEIQISKAHQTTQRINLEAPPAVGEIEVFAENSRKKLQDLSFAEKRAIVLRTVEKIIGTQQELQVSGYIPVTTNGWYTSNYRHCRIAERGEVHAF